MGVNKIFFIIYVININLKLFHGNFFCEGKMAYLGTSIITGKKSRVGFMNKT